MKNLKKWFMEQAVEAAVAALGNSVKRGLGRSLPWTTYNYQGGVLAGTATGPTYSDGKFTIAEVKLDFVVIAAARLAAGQAVLAQNDVLQAVGVPAGIYVPFAGAQCSVVEGAAATVDVGDGNSTAGFLSAFDLNVLGRTVSGAVQAYSVAIGGGVFYNVDDTIDVVLKSANGYAKSTLSLFSALVDLRKTR